MFYWQLLVYVAKLTPPIVFLVIPVNQGKNLQVFFFFFNTSYSRTSENAMVPHSSTLAWKTPWAEEPGRLQSMGSLRVGHD